MLKGIIVKPLKPFFDERDLRVRTFIFGIFYGINGGKHGSNY
jgi:hypothetical protein